MQLQIIQLLYLISAICFILSLKFLASRKCAVFGGMVGAIGVMIAVFATFCLPHFTNKLPIIITIFVGGFLGVVVATRVTISFVPQLMVVFHSLVGLSILFIAYSMIISPENFSLGISGHLSLVHLIGISVGASVGAITFSGSIITCMQLQGTLSASIHKFYGQRYISLLVITLLVVCMIFFINLGSILSFNGLVLLSLLVGGWLITFVGRAEMPVLISILNAYSGFAVAGIGFTLGNSLLIITGALVGSSGAILCYIMCRAMNKSFAQIIFGSFATQAAASQDINDTKIIKTTCAEDVAVLLKSVASVVIVPGYGMALTQAQYVIREMVDILDTLGVKVRFAIHPVAGRMPGHMNVLLAEAGIDYDRVIELEKINSDFVATDVVLVIGANDIINPAARNDPNSVIYGMQILEVSKAKIVLCIKQSMALGHTGINNELFYYDNTLMLFGNAKEVIGEIVVQLK